MKLQVLSDERFSCQSCTNCCRSWYVELMPGEKERIEKLGWASGDPLSGKYPFLRHGGKIFLARRGDGACLFLNESNGLCRIHEAFGMDAKPLGCQVFPYQIAPTFEGEASVIGRFDCPTVRKNIGATHTEELPNLRRYAAQVATSVSFSEADCCYLDRNQIIAITEFLTTLINGFGTSEKRVLFITAFCDLLSQAGADEVDRAVLAQMFPVLKQQVEAAAAAPIKRPNIMARMAFRTLLGLYLRRDEDVLNGRAGRIGRMAALTKLVLGFGSFRALGISHRPGSFRKSRLFHAPFQSNEPETFALYWRLIRNRLESFQFMGPANNGRDFLSGLRSLALLYPLILAVAKHTSAHRGSTEVVAEDVDYAAMVIEHSFGRLPILNQPWTRSIEKLLLEPSTFSQLVRTV